MADVVRVSSHSQSRAVAGAIAGIMRAEGHAELQAIGAAAISQAVKAIVIARTFLGEEQIDLVFVPSFVTLDIAGQERTAIRLDVSRWDDA